MRLLTRQEIADEFRLPESGVDARMSELGVAPYPPAKRGRGYRMLYDAEEITVALKNERERKLAKKEKRRANTRTYAKPERSIFEMSWREAEAILTASGNPQ